MTKLLFFFSFFLAGFSHAYSQIIDDLFKVQQPRSDFRTIAKEYQSLEISQSKLAELNKTSPSTLQLQLPFEGKSIRLDLHKVDIKAENFKVVELKQDNSRHDVGYSDGIFYQGRIDGVTKSFATISIFKDRITGVIADEKSNLVLGTVENKGAATDNYVLYRDTELKLAIPFSCSTIDTTIGFNNSQVNTVNRFTAVGEPVDIYIETDYQLYLDKGSSVTNVINYVLSFFNSVALLYENESIKIQVSEIAVWSGLDPEAASLLIDGIAMLNSFTNRLSNDFNGDYAHFITNRTNSGGGALVEIPCAGFPPKRFRAAVSGINNTYADFPVFSWTVFVFAHELGHNLGSQHTHWCGWPIGALDNCYAPEGPCAGPAPINGGTIMSYCTNSGNYINFNNGFGFYPGNKIRTVVSAAPCFAACRMTIEITKSNASCGSNNGSASVEVFDAVGDISYVWSNGQTGSTLSGVGPGTYHVTVKDAATGCQVMQAITISNTGPVMNVQLNPTRTAGFCAGSTVLLTATPNNNYSYQWYKDGVSISGATANTYAAGSPGYYLVNAIQDFCTVSRSIQVMEVAPPQAEISPTGNISFCSGNKNELNAYEGPGYFYQWFKNGSLINGAIDSVYSAQESGDYTVRVYAAGCESISSTASVTIHPSPESVITQSGNNQFCEGGNVTLFASSNPAYTYQWSNNSLPIPGATTSSYTTSVNGNYTVATTLGICTKESNTVTTVVLSNPVVIISPANSTIQKFQSQTLTASGANAYNWALQPAIVSYAGNTAVVKPLNTTTYQIEGISSNGCKGIGRTTIVVRGCGDVTELSATSYSPSRTIIRWKNPGGTTSDTLQYRLAGSSIWTSVFVIGESFELNGLEPGKTYEYNIIPLCATSDGVTSATNIFQTPLLTTTPLINLFPNPANDITRLEIIVSQSSQLQIGLFDGYGRKLRDVSAKEDLVPGQTIKQVNTTALSAGVYYLVVWINANRYALKLVITH